MCYNLVRIRGKTRCLDILVADPHGYDIIFNDTAGLLFSTL